ncbi:hypothetical protein N7495_007405 [Penicillium taxi]|uniref:uncharacterized protein n=1 Tax=Penicillium taxi TaxID=168475 RepID=UPI0025457438|nr:uncharacterized protein N7495_007405 [Penicillium taxi]KAJ5887364.1 hypothetical protein N7495_007405 [Penicillium taxi]
MSKRSLKALCLVNREWNETAKRFLNQHIIIRLRDGKIPIIPDDQRILTQARQVSLVAEFTPQSDRKTFRPNCIGPQTRERLDREYSDIPRVLEGAFLNDRNVPKAGFYVGGDWSPVIDLIRRIPYLHDVNIFVFYGGPIELFEALSQYHPTCRVSFFSTLMDRHPLRGCGMFPIIHPVWPSSPMLYAVHLTALEDSDRSPLFVHPDRTLQNFVLYAPNLKTIALRISSRCHPQTRREHLRGFGVDKEARSDKPPGPGRIETMSWPLRTEMTAEQFQDWQTITDFSILRSLNFGCIRNSTLLQSIVDDHPFRQLRRLTVALVPRKDDDGPKFWQAAESMFSSLPCLTHLSLLGMYTAEFANNVIGYKHGQTLVELGLHGEIQPESCSRGRSISRLCEKGQVGPIFSTKHVRWLADYCPSLQKLQICVQGYPDPQTDMSSALGRFPSLKKLDLVLNCLPQIDANRMPVPLRELTEFEKGMASDSKWGSDVCPRWFIRDCMINCAMSEIFVKQFFTQIRTSQQSLVQLVMEPLFSNVYQHTELDQYSSFRGGVKKFINYGFFSELASVWTVKQDNDTELHAIRKEPFNPAFLNFDYPDEILSIFRSTDIWETTPDVKTQ